MSSEARKRVASSMSSNMPANLERIPFRRAALDDVAKVGGQAERQQLRQGRWPRQRYVRGQPTHLRREKRGNCQ